MTHALFLFAPRALLGFAQWGGALEHIGSITTPRLGAFSVMAIDKAAV